MNFKTLTGRDELRLSLTRLVNTGRLSHAVLLTGPAGGGKYSWGRALARAILCREPAGGDACLQCISCRQFDSGNHPDYFLIEPEGRNIKIEQVRSLRTAFHLLGGKKVCLIKKAEAMTAEASSSLLKVLEEPPEGLYFILLAEQAQLLFETILSRCQHYHLEPLDRTEIQGLLMDAKGLSSEKAALLARLSRGIPGRAYELAEDEAFDRRFEEAETLALSLLSGSDSAYHLLAKAAELAERDDLLPFLDLLCYAFRDCLVLHFCSSDQLLIDPGRPALRQSEGAAGELENTIGLINNTVHELTATNVNRRLLLEKMLILMQRGFAPCQR